MRNKAGNVKGGRKEGRTRNILAKEMENMRLKSWKERKEGNQKRKGKKINDEKSRKGEREGEKGRKRERRAR